MAKHGKKYREAAARISVDKKYSPKEAFELVKAGAKAKFDETVELLGSSQKRADGECNGECGKQ